VSQYFRFGDLVLWNPSNIVARLFAGMTDAMITVAECPSGVAPDNGQDEYEIDPRQLRRVRELADRTVPVDEPPDPHGDA
jgi:hypothetical protein